MSERLIRGDAADRADLLVLRHADEGVYQARQKMQGQGCADCTDCGERLAPERRSAAPWAIRCTLCQSAADKKQALRKY